MVVINNIQHKRLEEIVFTIDEYALFIVENTFSVLGSTLSRRKTIDLWRFCPGLAIEGRAARTDAL